MTSLPSNWLSTFGAFGLDMGTPAPPVLPPPFLKEQPALNWAGIRSQEAIV